LPTFRVETAVNVTFSVTVTCHNIYLITYNQKAALINQYIRFCFI